MTNKIPKQCARCNIQLTQDNKLYFRNIYYCKKCFMKCGRIKKND